MTTRTAHDAVIETWTTEPPEFAKYIHSVRVTRAAGFTYIYVNFAVKRLELYHHEVVDGAAIITFNTRGDARAALWPPAAPWPAAPDLVRLLLHLQYGDKAQPLFGETGRYDYRGLFIDDYDKANGAETITRAVGMPPDYIDSEQGSAQPEAAA